jgi:hypothetical protein
VPPQQAPPSSSGGASGARAIYHEFSNRERYGIAPLGERDAEANDTRAAFDFGGKKKP